MTEKTFEDFLSDKHSKQYQGFDDEMPDAFNEWLGELDVGEVIKYAEEALVLQKKELLEKKDKEVRHCAYAWVKTMWKINALNPDKWESEEEVFASLVSYLEGNHRKTK